MDSNPSVFAFNDYRAFLRAVIEANARQRGFQTKMSEAARCQPSYLSQALQGIAHLSLDQLMGVARFLELDPGEWDYLREMSLYERATSQALREDCLERLAEMREKSVLQNSAQLASSSAKDHASSHTLSWRHVAILHLLKMKGRDSSEALAERLSIEPRILVQMLTQLRELDLVQPDDSGRWRLTQSFNESSEIDMTAVSPAQLYTLTSWKLHMLEQMWSGKASSVFGKHRTLALSKAALADLRKRITESFDQLDLQSKEPAEVIGFMTAEILEI